MSDTSKQHQAVNAWLRRRARHGTTTTGTTGAPEHRAVNDHLRRAAGHGTDTGEKPDGQGK